MNIERKSIFFDILFTLITGGLFNIWVQYRQIRDSNKILPHDKYNSFFLMMLFTIITFGLYFIWHEYRLTRDLHQRVYGRNDSFIEILCGIGTFFGLWFVVDSYQQNLLNEYVDGYSHR